MTRTTIFAAAAAAVIGGGALLAGPSPANATVDLHIGIPGVHIGVGPRYGYGYRDHSYGYRDCWTEYERVRVRYRSYYGWKVRWEHRPVRVCD